MSVVMPAHTLVALWTFYSFCTHSRLWRVSLHFSLSKNSILSFQKVVSYIIYVCVMKHVFRSTFLIKVGKKLTLVYLCFETRYKVSYFINWYICYLEIVPYSKAMWRRITRLPHKRLQIHLCVEMQRINGFTPFMRWKSTHKGKIAYMRHNYAFLPQ